jgi:TRAP-type C4-dicarboxylate transport system permease small subunit
MLTSLALVLEVVTWALLAAIAMGDFSAARSGGETASLWGRSKQVLGLVWVVVAISVMLQSKTGDASPLLFEFVMLLVVGALVAHDARARGEWAWSGRIHALLAVLGVLLVFGGRYVVTSSFAFVEHGSSASGWIAAIATLVLGVAPVIAYFMSRGPRLDGSVATVTTVKGVMGSSSDSILMALPRFIIAFVILAGIVINGANVIGRYIYLSPIIWAEEIMIYGMVWTVFIGSVLVTWDSRHLKMDLLVTSLPSPYREILAGIGILMFLAVCVFVVPQNWTVFSMMYNLDQRSIVAEVPMSIPHFALLFGFVLMGLAVLIRFRRELSGDLGSEIDSFTADDGDKPADSVAGQ